MQKYDDQNVFARIISGTLPVIRIYEDTKTLAFLDLMPQADGHALVIPKAPSRNILDIAPDDLSAAVLTAQRIARAAMTAFAADGVNVMQYNEPGAGQTVYHTHFHIIPRKIGVSLKPHAREAVSQQTLEAHADAYRRALGNL